ncbi:MAG: multicopper oxidase domain-containing protein [Bdellovibrionota bacterium]
MHFRAAWHLSIPLRAYAGTPSRDGANWFFHNPPKKAGCTGRQRLRSLLQIWSIPPHSNLPDTMSMNFNWFTINGKVAPSVPHLQVSSGEKVRVRIANISMMSHPIHMHGHTFKIVETGAGRNPESTHRKANTVSVNAGETMAIEFTASKWKGPWLLHCHFLHHITNDMDRNPIPGQPMDMPPGAGMFTIVDVQ